MSGKITQYILTSLPFDLFENNRNFKWVHCLAGNLLIVRLIVVLFVWLIVVLWSVLVVWLIAVCFG
jgi:hypothetical protein